VACVSVFGLSVAGEVIVELAFLEAVRHGVEDFKEGPRGKASSF